MEEIVLAPGIGAKLKILADAAKYDVACTSSGVDRKGKKGYLGNSAACGICHSFSADGRCISLLKILLSNHCVYDCKYCVNRAANDVPRATFTPEEICELTTEFYKRNYIEGLFLSSAVIKNPNYTMEKMCETLLMLRYTYKFNGYIHVKTIPGADDSLISACGFLADRISVNMELPTRESLKSLAPNKTFETILTPMEKISNTIAGNRLMLGKSAKMERAGGNRYLPGNIFTGEGSKKKSLAGKGRLLLSDACQFSDKIATLVKKEDGVGDFAPAGQSTQMIIGAAGETDLTLIKTTQELYTNYDLKRVFYSAYIPVNEDPLLPGKDFCTPLLREHRLYQADFLLRFYGFNADELLSEEKPMFDERIDPKCDWAIRHIADFPVEVQTAPYDMLLRVPGLGPKSAMRIVNARRYGTLSFDILKKIGVVLKRAHYFITCNGKLMYNIPIDADYITGQLTAINSKENWQIQQQNNYTQMTFADFGIG